MSYSWVPVGVALGLSGVAWWAGWAAFYRSVSQLVSELRAEIAAERESRARTLEQCLRAMADQRDDGIRAVGELARVVQDLAVAVRAREAPVA